MVITWFVGIVDILDKLAWYKKLKYGIASNEA